MRALCKVCLVIGLAVVLAGPAKAQGPRGGGGGVAQLLQNKSVQDELKLDKDQMDMLRTALTKFQQAHSDDLAKLRDQGTSREERMELMKKLNEASQKAVADILKPEQFKRLNQIRMQQEGLNALANPETQKALKLTDKQTQEIQQIAEDMQKEMREIFQNAGGNREEAMKKMMALRKDKMDSAMKVLNDEQRKTLKDMMGEPFELRREAPRRDRG
jgi:hypothetical protein